MESLEHKKAGYYRLKFRSKMLWVNKKTQLRDYFVPMIGDKKEVTIADLGSGPCSITGSYYKDVKVNLYPSDVLQEEYMSIWKYKCKADPLIPIEKQNIEKLTYPDNYFDIVHCENALDHTRNPKKAIEEMKRICKKGGWVYLRHFIDQRRRFRGFHYWDINIEGRDCVFTSKSKRFVLDGFKTTLENDVIISTLLK